MLLSFEGFNVRHFCFKCLSPLVSASDIALWCMSWACPSASCWNSSDGHESTADGDCLLVLVLVVLLRCDWKQEMQSCCCLLMSLLGIVLGCHLKQLQLLPCCIFRGRYFLILLQSYGAADVILSWQVLRHVQ